MSEKSKYQKERDYIQRSAQERLEVLFKHRKVSWFLERHFPDYYYGLSTTGYSSFHNIRLKNPEICELMVVPAISQFFGNKVQWTKEVVSYHAYDIVYRLTVQIDKSPAHIQIELNLKETCQILRIPTGRTKKVEKLFEAEEPEYEFKVQCAE